MVAAQGFTSEELQAAAWATSAPEGAILSRLGAELLGDGLGFGSRDEEKDEQFGDSWFDARLDKLRSAICSHPVIHELGGDGTNDILMIVPLILNHMDDERMLAILAAGVVMRRGIASFCRNG